MKTKTTLSLSMALVLAAGAARAQDVAPPATEPPPVDPNTVEAEPLTPVETTTEQVDPAPATPEKKPTGSPVAVKYDKGLVFASEDEAFELKLALRTQFRYQVLIQDDGDDTDEPNEELRNTITIPRLRLQLEGHLFGKGQRYKLELAAGDNSRFAFAKDMFIEKQLGPVWVRVGQWKQPFTRQELVSDFGSVFNERANTADWLSTGRDQGIAFHNDYEKSPEGLEWVVGVFQNFEGKKDTPAVTLDCEDVADPESCSGATATSSNNDFGPTLVARVGWNVGKVKGYTEADLDGGPLRLGFAVGVKYNLAELEEDAQDLAVSADLILKVEGFDTELAVFMLDTNNADGDTDALIGFTAQAGFMIIPKHGQVAARFSMRPFEEGSPYENQMEILGAFNWYFEGHSWKWANDFGIIQNVSEADGQEADGPDIRVRSMAQLTF